MGRVNLDQLEMMKALEDEEEKEDTRQEEEEEEEEEMMMMMAVDMGKGGGASFEEQQEEEEEEEEEEGEEGDDDKEDMDAVESGRVEHRGGSYDGGEVAGHEDDEEEEQEQGEVAAKEVETVAREGLVSPRSSSSSSGGGGGGGGLSGPERRLPCEFCGRCFTDCTEWERHVLRHGMLLNENVTEPSVAPEVLEAPPAAPPVESSITMDPGLDLSSHRTDGEMDGPLQTTPDLYVENQESL
ncbi:hypothetical protein CRUP_029618 [Coryphaenoides rupestris]|nr:hypothetical protein CRUP_029618 [Coryphaenoides rupestris]